jgi:hypothetical protein
MPERAETVLAYWKEHREQLRQSETQRSALTNYLLVVTGGLSSLIAQQKFSAATMPLAILIVVFGLYGALSAGKYHERADYHLTQARALTKTLKVLGALDGDDNLDEYREKHNRAFPYLHRLRLHLLWTCLHLVIALFGAALLVVIVAT